MTSSRRFRIAWWLALGLLVTLGLWLRYRDVTQQVLGGDEYHSIRVAADLSLAEIFTYYGTAENSMGLSLYARALMDTVGLTEFSYRLPALLSGLVVLLSPLLFRRRLGRSATLMAVALLATSPVAIYYSIVGRPYGPAAALLLISIWSWRRWITTPSLGRVTLFVVSSALAVFLHMLLLLPVGLMVALAWIEGRRRATLPMRRVVLMTGLLLVAGLCLFGPGLPGLIEFRLQDTTRPGDPSSELVWQALRRLAGEHRSTAWMLLVFMAVGAVRLARREALLGIVLASSLPVLVVGMFLTSVYPSDAAWTRYMFLAWAPALMVAATGMAATFEAVARLVTARPLAALPALAFGAGAVFVRSPVEFGKETVLQSWLPWFAGLLLVVASLEALIAGRRRPTGSAPWAGSGMLIAALLLATGTLAWTPVAILRPGLDSLRVRRESIKLVPEHLLQAWSTEVPAFFERLADDPDGGEFVLIWPYYVETLFWHPFIEQQKVHGKRILAVQEPPNLPIEAVGVDFRNITDSREFDELIEQGARYLVVYKDVEAIGIDYGLEPRDQDFYYESTFRPMLVGMHGPPVHSDEHVEVHDLWAQYYRPLTEGAELVAIERSDGVTFKLDPLALKGHVDVARVLDGRLLITGWALDPEAGQPADAVLFVTARGRIFAVPTGVHRDGLAKAFDGAPVGDAGFQLLLPVERFPDDQPAPLRAIAVRDGRATLLGYGIDAEWLQQ